MAQKKITADLNGGDALTAMADLLFQIHDASDDLPIASANYAAIGSVNNHGSDGANITYTLNASGGAGGNGQIILDGVDVGNATDIKIRCKDAEGNESVLSVSKIVGFKTVYNISEGQFLSATGLTALSTGVVKYAFNLPDAPTVDGTKICTIGTLVCSYSANQLRIGTSAGLDFYPATPSSFEGKDVEVTYLNTAPYTTTLKIDGVPITADTIAGTKAAASGNAIQCPTTGTDTISYKYLRVSEDASEIVTYEMNEGSGTNLEDTSGNNDDATITVGTGNISTVWV